MKNYRFKLNIISQFYFVENSHFITILNNNKCRSGIYLRIENINKLKEA